MSAAADPFDTLILLKRHGGFCFDFCFLGVVLVVVMDLKATYDQQKRICLRNRR